ncbi:AraC family transcriptional regulator [Microvirga yunnanensis]|uniref:AraC family transcriptional regulator n=1 Tax=Microvirga yunnanensis TaxID=2953740 RepID=UPI0021C8218E|nr:AraC family transcriptional regulator [Microvirga sp. HBU65207]
MQDGVIMDGAEKHASGEGPASDPRDRIRGRKERSGAILEHSYRSLELDEIEHVVSSQITPHKLVPLSRDRSVNSTFRFHGAENLAVFDIRYGSQIAVEFEQYEAGDLLGFVMANEGTGRVLLDREEFGISRNQGVMITSGPRETLHYAEDCETRVVLMNRGRIAEYCAKLLGRDIETPIDFQTNFSLDSAAGQSWLRLTQYVASELQDPHSMLKLLPEAQRQLEQTLLTSLLLGHSHTYSEALLRPQSAAAPFYVKRAEAFIKAHFAEPLSLADIAAHAGVSARSLQNGFQSFRGMTPMAFLRTLRLRRAQEALLLADPAHATVTEIALSCGFNHMGEFASLYRRTFGVSPRQTLSKTIYR